MRAKSPPPSPFYNFYACDLSNLEQVWRNWVLFPGIWVLFPGLRVLFPGLCTPPDTKRVFFVLQQTEPG